MSSVVRYFSQRLSSRDSWGLLKAFGPVSVAMEVLLLVFSVKISLKLLEHLNFREDHLLNVANELFVALF